MDYEVIEKINIRKDKCEKVGAFLYDREIDTMYVDCAWWFPVQLGIKGLLKCQVTPMFLKMPFLMKNWINQDILLRLVELLNLVKKDVILMHGSCVDNTLIVGLPNSGKTYQTYVSVAKGGKLISEEYTLIDKRGNASPYAPVMRTCFSKKTMDAAGLKMTLKEMLWMFASTIRSIIFPFMYEAVIWREVPASGDSAKIKKIVYGSTGKEIKDWKSFAILCENEFPFMASEFLQAYALATGFDLIGLQNKQRNLIKEFVDAVYPSSKS